MDNQHFMSGEEVFQNMVGCFRSAIVQTCHGKKAAHFALQLILNHVKRAGAVDKHLVRAVTFPK